MTFYKNYFALFFALVLFTGISVLNAQTSYRIGSTQEFKVEGTSTLHDWDMTSDNASGEASIVLDGQEIKEIASLRVNFPVRSLKSGNNRLDRTAYNSIDADKHTHVRFELTGVRNITSQLVLATGNLTIAGETRPVTIRTGYKVNGNSIQFVGNHSIKFSQFDLDPPTALLGTVRTGDELQISFNADFVPAVSSR